MPIYTELNEKIELYSKWGYYMAVYASLVGIGVLGLLTSYFNYYILDLNNEESFIVTTPLMYVVFCTK